MNILIADDDKDILESFKKHLIKHNHHVDLAVDGREAVSLIKENKYHLIFLDENMPELTGLEIVEYCRDIQSQAKTIIITGYQLLTDGFVKTIGADEYLQKPCHFKDIDAIIEKYS